MAAGSRVICRSEALADGGAGVRFEIERGGERVPAFVVRWRGSVYGYLNRCAHIGVQLDWIEGRFFDAEGAMLVCATHGARYRPATGRCAGGPCRGKTLEALTVRERDGWVEWED